MSIVSNDMNAIYQNSYLAEKRLNAFSSKTENTDRLSGHSFQSTLSNTRTDSISIGGNGSMNDDQFISRLSSDISNEVKAGKSESYLNSIKQQIALGDYDINADDIAGKILGF